MNKKVILTIDTKLLEDPRLKALFKELGITHKVNVDTAQASAAVRSLGDSIATAMAKFGLVKQGFDAALGIVQKISSAFIDPAAEMEQFRLRLNALYGSVEDASKAFEKFRVIAAKTPATLAEVVQAGANLKAFGLDAENTLEAVQDLAAFMGINVVEASQAVGRAFAGGAGAAIMLRDRGILELVRSFAQVEDLTKLTLPEFREALIGAMQDPMIGIAGASETLSQSYTGAMANLDDSLYTLRSNIGSYFTPVITTATNALADFIANLAGVGSNFQVVSNDAMEQRIQLDILTKTYEDLHKKTERTTEEQQLYQSTINDLLRIYPNYFNHIDLEKGKWDDIQKAISGAKDALNDWLNMKVQEAVVKDQQEELEKIQRKLKNSVKEEKRLLAEMDEKGRDRTSVAKVYMDGSFRTYGTFLKHEEDLQKRLKNKIKEKKKEIQEDIDLMKELFNYTPPAPETKDTPSSEQSEPRLPSYIPTKDDIEAALAELRRLYASDRELVQIEYERRTKIIKTAHKDGTQAAIDAYTDLDNWRTDQLESIHQKELDAEAKKQRDLEAIRALTKRQLLAEYDAEIQRLSNLKTIGALSYEELTASLKTYTERIKETFGDQSTEYAHALEAMRLAQLRISDTLAAQWKKDNARFLDIWGTTTSSMIAGFDSAWSSILNKNITGSQRLDQIWDAMRASFLNSIGNMTAQFIQSKATELAVVLTSEKSKQAAILQTLGIQESSFIATVAMNIKAAFSSLYESIANVWNWWTKLIPPPYSVAAAAATGATMIASFNAIKKSIGFASGGLISGPGTQTSDSIPILASNGEYIVNARSVAQPGVLPLLQHINALASPNIPFKSPAHFASGGLVQPINHTNNLNNTDLKELISEVQKLRSDVYKAQPTIIQKAPNPIEIHKMSESGRKLYKGY